MAIKGRLRVSCNLLNKDQMSSLKIIDRSREVRTREIDVEKGYLNARKVVASREEKTNVKH